MSNPDQSPALSLEEFRHWLNGRRMMDVSMAFGDIVERYREATEAAAMAATVPDGYMVMDWKAETNDPLAEMDAIMKVYEESMGIEPGPVMARVVGKTKQMLFTWWGWHRDTIRAALVAAKEAPVAGQPAEPSPASPLSDAQIKAAVHSAVKAGKLSWAGYEKDEAGEYTVPVLSPKHYQLARVIESTLAAPKGDSNG